MTLNTTPVSSIPISADYTSRDYYSLREDIISRIKDRVPEWSGSDPSDFGVALAEAFAYMGDIINYYIDRVANENYIMTATQRQSILDIAASLGYNPSSYRAATVDIQLTSESDTPFTLVTGTQFSVDVLCDDEVQQLIFTTTEDVVVPASSTVSVKAIHGEWASTRPENLANGDMDIAGEWVGTSNGLPDQIFQLSENQVVEGTVKVFVQNGDLYEEWTQVAHITDYGPNDPVYTVSIDGDNFVYIVFGDGISGAIPNNLSPIKVDYLIGGGILGNIASTVVEEIYSSPGVSAAELSSYSSALSLIQTGDGFGGAEPESNDNIRYAAPLYFTAQNRAITLKDFANLSLGVSEVGKANATAETPQSVTIFVGPNPDPADPFQFPGYTDDPDNGGVIDSFWTDIKESVLTYLDGKTQIGTSVTIAPPSYPKVTISIQYSKLPQFTYAQVEANLKAALLDIYSYTNSSFEQVIYPEEVEAKLSRVDGVVSLKVKELYRTASATPARDILIAERNEIFVFIEDEMNISAVDALGALTISDGTLNPPFNPSITNYVVALPNGTTTVTVTPSVVASTSIVFVNDEFVISGEISNPVAVPVGYTNLLVTVAADDGVTRKTYGITLVREA